MIEKEKSLKLVFAGSGPYAEPVFEALVKNFKDIALIIKGGISKESPVVQIAQKNKAEVFEVSDKEDLHEVIQDIQPNIVIVVSFGIIIGKETLKIPKHGFVNVHYSLLSKYRGASPVQSAILNGDKTSGITFQIMHEKIDEGNILYQEDVSVAPDDTTETLAGKMAKISSEKLPETLKAYMKGDINPQKQKGKPSYSKIIKKEDGHIDWNRSAEGIERIVRAYTPWPSAYTFWGGRMLKILDAAVLDEKSGKKPGTFCKIDSQSGSGMTGLYGIQTGKGILIVKKLQLEGKKALATAEFVKGCRDIIGSTLGKTER